MFVIGKAVATLEEASPPVVSARVEARALDVVAMKIVGLFRPWEVIGFGSSCEAVGKRALAKLGRPAADEIVESLNQEVQRRSVEVEIQLGGVPDMEAYDRIKGLAQSVPWVTDVRGGQFSADGVSTVFVRYPNSSVHLAAALVRKLKGKLRLVEVEWSRIVLEQVR